MTERAKHLAKNSEVAGRSSERSIGAAAMGRASRASELKTSACAYRAHPRVVSKELTKAEAVNLAVLGEVVEQAAIQVGLVLDLIGAGVRRA